MTKKKSSKKSVKKTVAKKSAKSSKKGVKPAVETKKLISDMKKLTSDPSAAYVQNEKYGHIDVLSVEEQNERAEEEAKKNSRTLEEIADEVMGETEQKVLLTNNVQVSEEKIVNRYCFYIVEKMNDNDFTVDTVSTKLYDDLNEAQDVLSDMEDGAIWYIEAKKVKKLGKTMQDVAA